MFNQQTCVSVKRNISGWASNQSNNKRKTQSSRLFSLQFFVCPPGVHAASAVGERVHAPGIPPQGSEEGGGQEDALQRLHHEWMVREVKILDE